MPVAGFAQRPSFPGTLLWGKTMGIPPLVLSLTAAPGLWVKEGLRAASCALWCLSSAYGELTLKRDRPSLERDRPSLERF